MYRFHAIILGISRIRENQTRLILLTEEYGKITTWWRKKNITGIDLGDIVEVVTTRDASSNHIKSMDVITPAWTKTSSYERVYAFLETLKILSVVTIEGGEHRSIFRDARQLIELVHSMDVGVSQYTIFQMRILKSIGSMDSAYFESCPILHYIYRNIACTPLEKVLASRKIQPSQIATIQQANFYSLHTLCQ